MDFVISQAPFVLNNGFTMMLAIIAIAAILKGNRLQTQAANADDLRKRMQTGLEVTIGKLNPNATPPKNRGDGEDATGHSTAYQALLKALAEGEKVSADAAAGATEVIGAAAPKPKKPRAPRKKKVAAASAPSTEAAPVEPESAGVDVQRAEEEARAEAKAEAERRELERLAGEVT